MKTKKLFLIFGFLLFPQIAFAESKAISAIMENLYSWIVVLYFFINLFILLITGLFLIVSRKFKWKFSYYKLLKYLGILSLPYAHLAVILMLFPFFIYDLVTNFSADSTWIIAYVAILIALQSALIYKTSKANIDSPLKLFVYLLINYLPFVINILVLKMVNNILHTDTL